MFFLAPVFGNDSIPPSVKGAASIVITVLLYPVLARPESLAVPVDLVPLLFLILKEIGIGVAIGMAGNISLTVIQFAGYQVGRLMALQEGGIIDPLFNESIDAVAQLQFILFMLIFLLLNGHHFIISLIAKSFDIVPIGGFTVSGALIEKLIMMMDELFALGIKFTAPIMALLLIATVAFGILGKAIPEMNLLILMLPLKISIGLLGLIVISPYMINFIYMLIQNFYRDLEAILHLV
jgi:flagellar biosynthetic protein FliR